MSQRIRYDAEEQFRRNLRTLMEERSLSNAELAEKMGWHRNYPARLKNGSKRPSLQMVGKLAQIMQCETWQFFLWE